jgi:hypothetical protein
MGLQIRGCEARGYYTRSSNIHRDVDKELKLSIFSKKDYQREHKKTNKPQSKNKHVTKGKNPKNQLASHDQLARLIYCPRLCQQTSTGSYGKKTFDPVKGHCFGCGYDK